MVIFLIKCSSVMVILFLKNSNRRIGLLITSGISTSFFAVHLLVEGYRVQLLLLYCFTILMLIVSVYTYFKAPSYRTSSRLKSTLINIFVVGILIIITSLLYAFPIFKLPEPTGKYKVGTQTFHFSDSNRDEIFDEAKEGKREFMVQVWYPAQYTSRSPSPFITNVSTLKPISKKLGLPAVVTEYLSYIKSHSYKDAEISTACNSYSLIILNHGYTSSRTLHTSQAENLASHGYIMAVIDHTYSTLATVFPDGRITTSKTDEYFTAKTDYQTTIDYRDKIGKVWTDDVTFTLDQFERINSGQFHIKFKGKIDLSHIGILGHSMGGGMAYDSSYDPRITAGINMDGGLYNIYDRDGINKPFMFIYSESGLENLNKVMQNYIYTDEELKSKGVKREEIDKQTKDKKVEIEHIKKVANNDGQVMYIENMEHYNFADIQFFTPLLKLFGVTGKISPQRATSIINVYTLNFFDKYLKNKDSNFLEVPNNQYPEVKFITSLFTK